MSQNVQTVLELLKDEVEGDVSSALEKMSREYSMTWMYKGKDGLFPVSQGNLEAELRDEVYAIKGRAYQIKHIAEGSGVVMVELIERYPDPDTGTLYQTPLVLVLEMEEGKVRTGRHYCDPRISHEALTPDLLERAYQGTKDQIVIE